MIGEFLYTQCGHYCYAHGIQSITEKRVVLDCDGHIFHLDRIALERNGQLRHKGNEFFLEPTGPTVIYGPTEDVRFGPPPALPIDWHINRHRERAKYLPILRAMAVNERKFYRKDDFIHDVLGELFRHSDEQKAALTWRYNQRAKLKRMHATSFQLWQDYFMALTK